MIYPIGSILLFIYKIFAKPSFLLFKYEIRRSLVPCNHVFKFLYDEHAEVIKYIPSILERNGYIFDGWFKEIECINQWDFDLDTVQADENKEEVGLYAKWIKNNFIG